MTEQQYNHCVDTYSDGLYRFALKNMKNTDDAMEVVQNTFEKLWIKKADVDFDRVKSYIYTVAYHNMVDIWREAKRVTEITPEMENNNIESRSSEYFGLKKILDKALQQLPEIQRTVITLRDYEGYSYTEIGEITNLNESQVKVYIFRARQTLKTFIGSLEAVL